MALPQIKLALIFANFARKHGHKLLHLGNTDLLIRDLGKSMKEQLKILRDPDAGTVMTVADLLPQVAETKIFMGVVSNRLGIDTKGKSAFEVLNEIVQTTEAAGSDSAKDIKEALDWGKDFFSSPEIAELFGDEAVEISVPRRLSLGEFKKSFTSIWKKAGQEGERLHKFIKLAKEKAQEGDLNSGDLTQKAEDEGATPEAKSEPAANDGKKKKPGTPPPAA